MKIQRLWTNRVEEATIYALFPAIFGFEEFTDYVALQDDEVGDNIIWLQSAQNPQLCFILLDPSGIPDLLQCFPQAPISLWATETASAG